MPSRQEAGPTAPALHGTAILRAAAACHALAILLTEFVIGGARGEPAFRGGQDAPSSDVLWERDAGARPSRHLGSPKPKRNGKHRAIEQSGSVLSNHVVCTVAENAYFHGVAALLNSLVRANFEGTMVVGYRGEQPPWLNGLEKDPASGSYVVTGDVRLQLVALDGLWSLNNYKAHLIQKCLFDLHQEAELVYYFDADIVVTQSWETFAEWARIGVVLVLDIADTYMSPHHPYRRAWAALATRLNRRCREFTGYVNSGCVGISRAHADFVAVWIELMKELERDGADMRKLRNHASKLAFSRMDQDMLNATIMATDVPIALLGIEAMGSFPWVGSVMLHALWRDKPWQRNYVVDALRGFPPDRAHLGYWQFVEGPIRPFGGFELFRKRIGLRLGRSIGLLHMRSSRDL